MSTAIKKKLSLSTLNTIIRFFNIKLAAMASYGTHTYPENLGTT